MLKYEQEDIVLSATLGTLDIYSDEAFQEPQGSQKHVQKVVEMKDFTVFLDRYPVVGYEEPVLSRTSLSARIAFALEPWNRNETMDIQVTTSQSGPRQPQMESNPYEPGAVPLDMQYYANCPGFVFQIRASRLEFSLSDHQLEMISTFEKLERELLMAHSEMRRRSLSSPLAATSPVETHVPSTETPPVSSWIGWVYDTIAPEHADDELEAELLELSQEQHLDEPKIEVHPFLTIQTQVSVDKISITLRASSRPIVHFYAGMWSIHIHTVTGDDVLLYDAEFQVNHVEIVHESIKEATKNGPPREILSWGSRPTSQGSETTINLNPMGVFSRKQYTEPWHLGPRHECDCDCTVSLETIHLKLLAFWDDYIAGKNLNHMISSHFDCCSSYLFEHLHEKTLTLPLVEHCVLASFNHTCSSLMTRRAQENLALRGRLYMLNSSNSIDLSIGPIRARWSLLMMENLDKFFKPIQFSETSSTDEIPSEKTMDLLITLANVNFWIPITPVEWSNVELHSGCIRNSEIRIDRLSLNTFNRRLIDLYHVYCMSYETSDQFQLSLARVDLRFCSQIVHKTLQVYAKLFRFPLNELSRDFNTNEFVLNATNIIVKHRRGYIISCKSCFVPDMIKLEPGVQEMVRLKYQGNRLELHSGPIVICWIPLLRFIESVNLVVSLFPMPERETSSEMTQFPTELSISMQPILIWLTPYLLATLPTITVANAVYQVRDLSLFCPVANCYVISKWSCSGQIKFQNDKPLFFISINSDCLQVSVCRSTLRLLRNIPVLKTTAAEADASTNPGLALRIAVNVADIRLKLDPLNCRLLKFSTDLSIDTSMCVAMNIDDIDIKTEKVDKAHYLWNLPRSVLVSVFLSLEPRELAAVFQALYNSSPSTTICDDATAGFELTSAIMRRFDQWNLYEQCVHGQAIVEHVCQTGIQPFLQLMWIENELIAISMEPVALCLTPRILQSVIQTLDLEPSTDIQPFIDAKPMEVSINCKQIKVSICDFEWTTTRIRYSTKGCKSKLDLAMQNPISSRLLAPRLVQTTETALSIQENACRYRDIVILSPFSITSHRVSYLQMKLPTVAIASSFFQMIYDMASLVSRLLPIVEPDPVTKPLEWDVTLDGLDLGVVDFDLSIAAVHLLSQNITIASVLIKYKETTIVLGPNDIEIQMNQQSVVEIATPVDIFLTLEMLNQIVSILPVDTPYKQDDIVVVLGSIQVAKLLFQEIRLTIAASLEASSALCLKIGQCFAVIRSGSEVLDIVAMDQLPPLQRRIQCKTMEFSCSLDKCCAEWHGQQQHRERVLDTSLCRLVGSCSQTAVILSPKCVLISPNTFLQLEIETDPLDLRISQASIDTLQELISPSVDSSYDPIKPKIGTKSENDFSQLSRRSDSRMPCAGELVLGETPVEVFERNSGGKRRARTYLKNQQVAVDDQLMEMYDSGWESIKYGTFVDG